MIGLEITAEFNDEVNPSFPEALVRGGLGYGIRRMMCVNRSAEDCGQCMIHRKCLYGIMFSESGKTRNGLQVSPYGIHCRVEGGNRLAVNLTLYGPLLDYYGHLVAALAEIGRQGIGKGRNNYTIREIADTFAPGKRFAMEEMEGFRPTVKEWLPSLAERRGEQSCSVEFISSTRIERRGELQSSPSFGDIVKSCIMRYLNLERAFSEGAPELAVPAKGIIQEAAPVRTVNAEFAWQRKDRYSLRQRARVSAGGFTGRAVYRGETGMFEKLLAFGSHAGIGKNTSFGCGRFRYRLE